MNNFFDLIQLCVKAIQSIVEVLKSIRDFLKSLNLTRKTIWIILGSSITLLTVALFYYQFFPISFIDSTIFPNKNDIIFGYREDAKPISYEDNGPFKGYCFELKEFLEKNDHFSHQKIKPVKVNYRQRFEGIGYDEYKKYKIDLDCGPNTITSSRKKYIERKDLEGNFSNVFGVSGANLMIKKDYYEKDFKNKLTNNKPPFDDKNKIAVLENTTTLTLINHIFPSSTANPVVEAFPNRDSILANLKGNKEFVAYGTDDVLLGGFFKTEDLKEKYVRFLDNIKDQRNMFLSFEEYGIIVYKSKTKNKSLYTEINKWIKQCPLSSYDIEQEKFPNICRFNSDKKKQECSINPCSSINNRIVDESN